MPPRKRSPTRTVNGPDLHILSVDVGGSGIKASVLDAGGAMLADRLRVRTPVGKGPVALIEAVAELAARLPAYDRVSLGFPGVVRDGRVLTAPNVGGSGWDNFELAAALEKRLDRPARLLNDADMQGYGAIRGRGMEMVVTLGTGFGSALFQDGVLGPHLELAHHPLRRGDTYNEQLGERERRRIGDSKWVRRVLKTIEVLRALTLFDHLYVGGGNARHLELEPGQDVSTVQNEAGITGGAALWRTETGWEPGRARAGAPRAPRTPRAPRKS